ncbi:MAG TPA: hypothetical protein VK709_09015 [Candidatus Saccharimonadales bacterium]|nr:hypothetical protein [Candidatus Saccharimonadales bacterium]
MIGMSFSAFLTLLVLGLLSSIVLHTLVRYRVLAGLDDFVCKWIVGWIGAWLGSTVYGYWGIHMENIYIIPAVLGAFTAPFLATAALRALARTVATAPRQDAATSQPSTATQFEMRKAS